MSRPRLKVSVLCLTLAPGVSWSLAAAPPRISTPVRASAIEAPWNHLLAYVWGSLPSLWEQTGATLDPSGRSGNRPTTDAGATADTNGRTVIRPTTDNGATADPNG